MVWSVPSESRMTILTTGEALQIEQPLEPRPIRSSSFFSLAASVVIFSSSIVGQSNRAFSAATSLTAPVDFLPRRINDQSLAAFTNRTAAAHCLRFKLFNPAFQIHFNPSYKLSSCASLCARSSISTDFIDSSSTVFAAVTLELVEACVLSMMSHRVLTAFVDDC